MARINVAGWEADKARRASRVATGLCPMCAAPKRTEDQYDSDTCKAMDVAGGASKEGTP